MADLQETSTPRLDLEEHERTYKWFVRGVFIFAAHVLAILLVLAWVFADSFGTTPLPT